MTYTWQDVLVAESRDVYHRSALRVLIPTGLMCYVGYVLWWGWSNEHGASHLDYTSPEGLRVPLRSPFSQLLLRLHFWSAVAMIPLVIIQKHLTPAMAFRTQQAGGALDDAASNTHNARARWLRDAIHPALGGTILMCMILMAAAGFFLRGSPAFAGFSPTMILFVAPWVIFIPGLALSPGLLDMKRLHAVLGNCVFKACVAVPLARVFGVALQRILLAQEARATDPDVSVLGRGYYLGIAASAVVIGVWAAADLTAFLRGLPPSAAAGVAPSSTPPRRAAVDIGATPPRGSAQLTGDRHRSKTE